MQRRVITDGYHPKYIKKILVEARNYYGSVRKIGFAMGLPSSVVYRWYNNEEKMGAKWVLILEQILKKVSQ